MSDLSVFIVVFMIEGQIVPIGEVYYDISKARLQKEKLINHQYVTIIKLQKDRPPSVVF